MQLYMDYIAAAAEQQGKIGVSVPCYDFRMRLA
jgi:hypothetical protein